MLTFCKSKRLQLIDITYCTGFPNSWLSWRFFEHCQISNSLPALSMGWPTRALSRSKSGGTSLCITVALQEIRSLRGLQREKCNASNGLQFTVIASISWMMILVTLALGAFASAAPAGWPLFFQLLPGRSFIFWKYATGRQNAA